MFKAFNLTISKDCVEGNVNVVKGYWSDIKEQTERDFQKYVKDGIADVTKIENDWFPSVDVNVFISHSHADEELAKCLAAWLYKNFSLKSFIDSYVWGYCDDLLDEINGLYSYKRHEGNRIFYDHRLCNVASKHVDTILNIALQKMIDKTEVVFFLKTQNSIESCESCMNDATYSPWIYSELVCTKIIRKRKIEEHRTKSCMEELKEAKLANDGLTAKYEVNTEHLIELNDNLLNQWLCSYKSYESVHPLDCLYDKIHPLDLLYKIVEESGKIQD